jgi:hypothetical protein
VNVFLQSRFLDVAIHHGVVAERDIRDNEIELILQKTDILKGIVENHVLAFDVRVEIFQDLGRQFVQLDLDPARDCVYALRGSALKMTDAR